MNDITLTVVEDRYNGCYSGARYTAWIGEPPWDIDDGDAPCMNFWCEFRGVCGKGDTSLAAIADLLAQL